jgi:hypothetical protein
LAEEQLKLTEYLAIYAALLSTIVFVWNVLRSRPRLKVDLIFCLEGSDDNLRSGVDITVRNMSPHEVHLAAVGVLVPFRRVTLKERFAHLFQFKRLPLRIGWVHLNLSRYSVETGCPVRLEARSSHRVFIAEDIIEKILSGASEKQLMAMAQDQLWNNVYSRPFEWRAPKA